MWIADPIAVPPFNAIMNWPQSIINCEACVFAGHTDWRLPNIKELGSIVDYAFSNPPVDPGIFTIYTNKYASSTTHAITTTSAWYLDSANDYIIYQAKASNFVAMPVRLGLPA